MPLPDFEVGVWPMRSARKLREERPGCKNPIPYDLYELRRSGRTSDKVGEDKARPQIYSVRRVQRSCSPRRSRLLGEGTPEG
jgi:hypothetical protein